MSIFERIEKICFARGISVEKLESELLIVKGTEQTSYSRDELAKMSEYFSVPLDFLLGAPDRYGLSPDQWYIIGKSFGDYCTHKSKDILFLANKTGTDQQRVKDFVLAGVPVTREDLYIFADCLNERLERIIDGLEKHFERFEFAANSRETTLYAKDTSIIMQMRAELSNAERFEEGPDGQTD